MPLYYNNLFRQKTKEGNYKSNVMYAKYHEIHVISQSQVKLKKKKKAGTTLTLAGVNLLENRPR